MNRKTIKLIMTIVITLLILSGLIIFANFILVPAWTNSFTLKTNRFQNLSFVNFSLGLDGEKINVPDTQPGNINITIPSNELAESDKTEINSNWARGTPEKQESAYKI